MYAFRKKYHDKCILHQTSCSCLLIQNGLYQERTTKQKKIKKGVRSKKRKDKRKDKQLVEFI
jgi:hypothetical protein